jgi:hypothetical protein
MLLHGLLPFGGFRYAPSPEGQEPTSRLGSTEFTDNFLHHQKTAPSKLNKTPNEVDILLGQFNDLTENLEIVKSFLNSASNKEVLSAEEKKLVSHLQGIVPQLNLISS